jgi:hypothetical protein
MALDSVFEFLKSNFFNTTTQISVNNNTGTAENLLNPDTRIQYYTDGMNDDLTTCSITISFESTQTVSRLALKEMNFKKFNVYYNGATANAFSLTTTGSTISSQFLTNSETSMFLRCASVDCTSVTIDIYSTQLSNSEKAIGSFYVSDEQIAVPRRPSSSDYTPKIDPEQVVHTMSDGGVRLHTVKDKYAVDLKFKNISRTFRDDLKSLYDLRTSFIFCPMGTSTGWDEVLFEAVWPGNFDFYKFSDDAVSSGYTGTISLKEVST